MGFFNSLKNKATHNFIGTNGLATGTTYENCEQCKFRVNDPGNNYWYCARYKMHVSSKQVCGNFSRGAPIYKFN